MQVQTSAAFTKGSTKNTALYWNALFTLHFTLYTLYFILNTIHCTKTLHGTEMFVDLTAHWTLYTAQKTLHCCTEVFAQCGSHWTLKTLYIAQKHCTALKCLSSGVHSVQCTNTYCTLNVTSYTLHCKIDLFLWWKFWKVQYKTLLCVFCEEKSLKLPFQKFFYVCCFYNAQKSFWLGKRCVKVMNVWNRKCMYRGILEKWKIM